MTLRLLPGIELEHLGNVKAMLEAALKLADLIRIEVHGPAAELENLKGTLAHLDPARFVLDRCRLALPNCRFTYQPAF